MVRRASSSRTASTLEADAGAARASSSSAASNRACDFTPRTHREGLPILVVDEQIYRELPAFLIATVDKFAMLPWRGEAGVLFGQRRARATGRGFYGAAATDAAEAERGEAARRACCRRT